MNRHKRSHYKTKSRLFLFGEKKSVPEKIDTTAMVRAFLQQQAEQRKQKEGGHSKAMLNPEAESDPAPEESLDSLYRAHIANINHNQAPQQISLAGFEITASGTLHGNASDNLDDGSSFYAMDTKLMIPQTIMQNQDDGDLDLETTI